MMLIKDIYHWENQKIHRVSAFVQSWPSQVLHSTTYNKPLCTSCLCSWSIGLTLRTYTWYTLRTYTFRGEWPSELRPWDYNWKVPCSNPTKRSTELSDPTRYETPSDYQVEILQNAVINIGIVRLSPWEWSKVGRGKAKPQFKKIR